MSSYDLKKEKDGVPTGMTVCFTGHRQISYGDAMKLPALLETVLTDLIQRGAVTFRAGGAIGFDTVAALKVLELRETHPHIRLELILPCRNQTDRWDDTAVRTYQYILERADEHRFLFNTYFEGCMLERDRALDLIDEIRAKFPVELEEAQKLIAGRNDYIASAKREAESIKKQAELEAQRMLASETIYNQAKQRSIEIMRQADERSRELKRSANEYCEDALRRTEEAVAEAYEEIRKSRARFRAAAAGNTASGTGQSGRIVYDASQETHP